MPVLVVLRCGARRLAVLELALEVVVQEPAVPKLAAPRLAVVELALEVVVSELVAPEKA